MSASYYFNHRFNEQTKRFVPKERTCVFCKEIDNQVTADSIHYVPVYKLHDSTYLVVYSSVKYEKVEVGLPRCTACQEIHTKDKKNGNTIAILLGVGCLIAGMMYGGAVGAMIGLFIGVIVGIGASSHLEEDLDKKDASVTIRQAAEADNLIQTMVVDGWTLEKPTP